MMKRYYIKKRSKKLNGGKVAIMQNLYVGGHESLAFPAFSILSEETRRFLILNAPVYLTEDDYVGIQMAWDSILEFDFDQELFLKMLQKAKPISDQEIEVINKFLEDSVIFDIADYFLDAIYEIAKKKDDEEIINTIEKLSKED
jgi:hypothetical protein